MCDSCDQVSKIRHSLSHIMAQAVQRVQQFDVEIAIGPSIDSGFYYDFLFSEEKQIKDEDLGKVQDMCIKIIKENQTFTRIEVSNEESKDIVENLMKQHKDEGAVKSLNDDEGDNLEQELASELSGDLKKVMLTLASAFRSENPNPDNHILIMLLQLCDSDVM